MRQTLVLVRARPTAGSDLGPTRPSHTRNTSDVPLLGKIPFSPALRTGGDDGAPIVDADPSSPAAIAISEVAEKLMKRSKSLLGVRLGVST